MTTRELFLPWTPSEDMRWRPFVPPPVRIDRVRFSAQQSHSCIIAHRRTNADGRINCAPMGVEWGDEVIVLKPFLETATYRNVTATRSAVVNLTDDVRVFAQAAISNPVYATVPAAVVARRGARRLLFVARARGPDAWTRRRRGRASRRPSSTGASAASSSASTARAMPCSRRRSTPLGCTCWNRRFVQSELARLQVIVDKTAGEREREAMALLSRTHSGRHRRIIRGC